MNENIIIIIICYAEICGMASACPQGTPDYCKGYQLILDTSLAVRNKLVGPTLNFRFFR